MYCSPVAKLIVHVHCGFGEVSRTYSRLSTAAQNVIRGGPMAKKAPWTTTGHIMRLWPKQRITKAQGAFFLDVLGRILRHAGSPNHYWVACCQDVCRAHEGVQNWQPILDLLIRVAPSKAWVLKQLGAEYLRSQLPSGQMSLCAAQLAVCLRPELGPSFRFCLGTRFYSQRTLGSFIGSKSN